MWKSSSAEGHHVVTGRIVRPYEIGDQVGWRGLHVGQSARALPRYGFGTVADPARGRTVRKLFVAERVFGGAFYGVCQSPLRKS